MQWQMAVLLNLLRSAALHTRAASRVVCLHAPSASVAGTTLLPVLWHASATTSTLQSDTPAAAAGHLQCNRLSGARGGWYAGKLLFTLFRRRDAQLGESVCSTAHSAS